MNTHNTLTNISYIVLALIVAACLVFAFPGTGSAHTSSGTGSSTANGIRKNVDATCMAAAVDVREEALMDAWETMSTDIVTALTARKTALHSAWELTDVAARNTAVKNAWKEWKADKKEIHADFRNERKAAWAAFKQTAKTSCKVTVPKDEGLEKAASDSIAI
jgi:hypothetical protein